MTEIQSQLEGQSRRVLEEKGLMGVPWMLRKGGRIHKISLARDKTKRERTHFHQKKSCSLSPLQKSQNPHTPGLFSAEALPEEKPAVLGVQSSQAGQHTNLLTEQLEAKPPLPAACGFPATRVLALHLVPLQKASVPQLVT